MTYSAREHITRRLSSRGSAIAINEHDVTAILNQAMSAIANNPALSVKAAVNLYFAD